MSTGNTEGAQNIPLRTEEKVSENSHLLLKLLYGTGAWLCYLIFTLSICLKILSTLFSGVSSSFGKSIILP